MNVGLRIALKSWRLALAAFILLGPGNKDVTAQDVHFSQFYENALLRNPGLVGIYSGDYRATLNYRSQWSGAGVPFTTYTGSAEMRFGIRRDAGDYLSVGLSSVADHAGTISFRSSTTYLGVNYSKKLNNERSAYLSAGFAGGFIQRSYDPSRMTFASQYNGGTVAAGGTDRGVQSSTLQHFDVAAGVSLNGTLSRNGRSNYYLGAAGYHLSRPKEAYGTGNDFISLAPRLTGTAGVRVGLGARAALTAHALYQYQHPHQMVVAGLLVSQQFSAPENPLVAFSAGCFFRAGDAIIPTVRLDVRQLSFLASYDAGTGEKRTYLNGAGGTEFSLILRGKVKHAKPDNMACPRFEEFLEYW